VLQKGRGRADENVMGSRLALLLALVVGLVATGCGGAESPVLKGPALRSLAQAARATEQTGSYRFDLALEMSMPGQSQALEVTAEGAVDEAGRRAVMTMDFGQLTSLFGGLGGQLSSDDLRMELRFDWPVMYVRMPFLADKLPGGKEWISLDIEDFAKQQGVQLPGVGSFGQSDPSAFLDFLKASTGGLRVLGTEKVGGVQTRHYLTKIDLGELAKTMPAAQRKQLEPALQQLGRLTSNGAIAPLVDAWVDGDGLLRRFTMTFSMPTGAQSFDLGMTMNLHDFGASVNVEAPDPAEVADASSLPGLGG
jgi:hypothetical protein